MSAANAGWFDATGMHDGLNKNYGLGPTGLDTFHGGRLRNFFVFDLSGLTGQVMSAELSAPSYGSHGGPAVLTLYDISTSPAVLGATVEGATPVFGDLGSGTSYGAVTVADPTASLITVPFSVAGVTALQAGLGGTFAVGGDYAPGATTAHSLFENTHDHPSSDVHLLITMTPASTTTVAVARASTTTPAPTTVPRAGAATTVTSPPTTRAAVPKATVPTAVPPTTAHSATVAESTSTTATAATTATTPSTASVTTGGRVVLAGSTGDDGPGGGAIAVGAILVLGAFLLLRWKYAWP